MISQEQTAPHAPLNKASHKNSNLTDEELIGKVLSGEKEMFELIMRRYNQRLYRITRSILKEDDEALDAVQETYVNAYFQLHQYQGPKGFASWLSRIASNEAMMRLRKNKRLDYNLDSPEHQHDKIKSHSPQPIDQLANQQLRLMLEHAIDQLQVNYRCVYMLRAVQQLSTRETASSLGLSEDVVKTRFKRAKSVLRATFQQHLDKAELNSYEFAGQRCNTVVKIVLEKISQQ